ncbi:hypothetical protein AAF712_002969 [Marasmius tenuissimus]|uniref:Uncharacterized protein n=1 Tax=Marasmius tenuissimus TaxID=585030 RepID=A0ABR3A9L2_9AGAR
MSDDGVFSAPKIPASLRRGRQPQYSPAALRLIRDTGDSDLLSHFSPSAFGEVQRDAGPDATLDTEADELDDIIICTSGPETTGQQSQQSHSSPLPLSAAPVAGSSSLVTPALRREVVAYQIFSPTPNKKALGRDYSRSTIFQKASIMHIYGGLGVLTLLEYGLHMCHVLAVALDDKLVSLESTRYSLQITASLHSAIDSGLIKILPSWGTMLAIQNYLDELHTLRKECKANRMTSKEYYERVDGDLRRRTLFPPANYPYRPVGVLCKSGFAIPRHIMDGDPSDEIPEEVHNQDTEFEVQIKRFPVPLWRTCPNPPKTTPANDSEDTEDEKVRLLPDFRSIDPTKYREEEVFWLWQDPFFVAMNAGEFIHTLRTRWNVKHPGPKEAFRLATFVEDEQHRKLLQMAFDIYEKIRTAPAPPVGLDNDAGGEQESLARRLLQTRSRNARSRSDRQSTRATNRGAPDIQDVANSQHHAHTHPDTPSGPAQVPRAGTRSKASTSRQTKNPEEVKSQGTKKRKAPEDNGDDASTSRRGPSPRRSKRNKEAPENGLYVQPPGRRL